MPKVSAKRQITLPQSQCNILDIHPGDEVESFIADGRLTIVKKTPGAAAGLLAHIMVESDMTDEDSLQDGLVDREHQR